MTAHTTPRNLALCRGRRPTTLSPRTFTTVPIARRIGLANLTRARLPLEVATTTTPARASRCTTMPRRARGFVRRAGQRRGCKRRHGYCNEDLGQGSHRMVPLRHRGRDRNSDSGGRRQGTPIRPLRISNLSIVSNTYVMPRLTSKGQVTVPVAVRYALGLAPGDDVVFAVDGDRGVFRRATALDDLSAAFPGSPRAGAHALERLLVAGDPAFAEDVNARRRRGGGCACPTQSCWMSPERSRERARRPQRWPARCATCSPTARSGSTIRPRFAQRSTSSPPAATRCAPTHSRAGRTRARYAGTAMPACQ